MHEVEAEAVLLMSKLTSTTDINERKTIETQLNTLKALRNIVELEIEKTKLQNEIILERLGKPFGDDE